MKSRILKSLACLALSLIVGFAGWILGYSYGTGEPPFITTQTIFLPTQVEEYTAEDVEAFVESDKTDLDKYDVGFNCVEYALLLARNARWKGIPAQVVALRHGDDTGHIILAFPTIDEGWVFIEPGTDEQIYPEVNKIYGGKRTITMEILRLEWVPFEEFCEEVRW